MNRPSVRFRSLPAGALLALLAACGQDTHPASIPTAPVRAAVAEPDAVLALLVAGDTGGARKRLAAALKRDPMNSSLLVLRDSIEKDARTSLGPESYPYEVRSGDTLVGVAERLLGNRLKAYQLARYNALATPVTLTPGQTLRIPGEAPRPPQVAVPRPAPVKPRAPAAPAPARSVAAKPAAPAANPAAARQARAAGLAALNQGKVVLAVAQLRRAVALDPANPQVAHDLTRAERIAATVQSRR